MANSHLGDQQAGIVAAEAEAVAHGVFDVGTACDVGHIVQIAFGVGFIVIDGGAACRGAWPGR